MTFDCRSLDLILFSFFLFYYKQRRDPLPTFSQDFRYPQPQHLSTGQPASSDHCGLNGLEEVDLTEIAKEKEEAVAKGVYFREVSKNEAVVASGGNHIFSYPTLGTFLTTLNCYLTHR